MEHGFTSDAIADGRKSRRAPLTPRAHRLLSLVMFGTPLLAIPFSITLGQQSRPAPLNNYIGCWGDRVISIEGGGAGTLYVQRFSNVGRDTGDMRAPRGTKYRLVAVGTDRFRVQAPKGVEFVFRRDTTRNTIELSIRKPSGSTTNLKRCHVTIEGDR